MRRLARYALNALTVLSLLLCVATVALWVRSFWRRDYISYFDGAHSTVIASDSGDVIIMQSPLLVLSGKDPQLGWNYVTEPADPGLGLSLAYFLDSDRHGLRRCLWFASRLRNRALVLAHPVLVLALAALSACHFFSPMASAATPGPLPSLQLRPPRHARPLPGMRGGAGGGDVNAARLNVPHEDLHPPFDCAHGRPFDRAHGRPRSTTLTAGRSTALTAGPVRLRSRQAVRLRSRASPQ